MIIEVNDAGEVLVPAELINAPPHTRLEVDRRGDALVLKPLYDKPSTDSVSSLLTLAGRLADPQATFHREDIYGPDGR